MAKQPIIADQQTQQSSPTKFIAIFLAPIFVIGLILFLVWLGLHPHFPSFQIQNFSVPGLDQLNGFRNVNITFNVTVRNPNRSTWIHYESIDGSVYYKDQKVGVLPLLHSFNQSPKNTTILQQVFGWTVQTMSSANNHRWKEIMNDRKEGTVKFSVKLASFIRFKKSIWDRRHHWMHAECDIDVGPDGLILPSSVHDRCPVNLS